MWTVEWYPPAREDSFIFSCKEKPEFKLSEESQLHTLMVSFVPTNGPSRGKRVTTPAACCLVEERDEVPA